MTAPTPASKAAPAKARKALLPKIVAMFLLGFASGLPYAALIGTLNAWLAAAGIKTATIGVLSWIGLAYAFKFLWSPLFGVFMPPMFKPGGKIGRWRAWILVAQGVIVGALFLITRTDPANSVGWLALMAFTASLASASQDVVIDAWRIKIAETSKELDQLSTMYQFGYRVSAFFAGFAALLVAGRVGWEITYTAISMLMFISFLSTFLMPDAPESNTGRIGRTLRLGSHLSAERRNRLFYPVMIAWALAGTAIITFMVAYLGMENPPSIRTFTTFGGPLIIIATVIFPAVVAAMVLRDKTLLEQKSSGIPVQTWSDHLYIAILEPMIDLVGRLRWAALLVLIIVLFYRYTDAVWGSFAYPFYMGLDTSIGAQGFTYDEVAVASKLFGVGMTIVGIASAGFFMAAFGRMPCMLAGAILAALTNLLFADLANGGATMDAITHAIGFPYLYEPLNAFINWTGLDATMNDRLARLMLAIAGENLVGGFAGVVFVAFLSSIVNKEYAAVQYALLLSMTMLIGNLGKPFLGELIDERGFAWVFVLTAVLGLIAVFASIAEWVREAKNKKANS